MSAPSLIKFAAKRPWLIKLLTPVANWYANAAGYRQMGLLADDLISEENETVLKALSRLPPDVTYDRIYRIRRATQLSLQHKILPKSEWVKPEEDVPYLAPLIAQIEAEEAEKAALDTLAPIRKH
ncbi:cytochrome b-c1 complex subunit 7 [Echria macrotheca]|uniref:Complex III subunit 7 n=1 Tax=Echria macrotheca TaxID=438768 RepID=A0AAJ0BGQ7_9PEZI|nr:cytochrome b-c1 complex subunit 7 [Echria macrotheca]